MLEARTIGIAIDRPWRQVYEAIWQPEVFPKWASGLSRSSLERNGDRWNAVGPEGKVSIRFTHHNDFGIMDHYVDVGAGQDIYVPLRVIANANGSEVLLTLFRQPGMSEAAFAADCDWVARDLLALRALMTG